MPKHNNDMVRMTVFVPRTLLDELKALSAKRGEKYSYYVRESIRKFLDSHHK